MADPLHQIRPKVTSTIREFNMIGPGDRILVAVSGGKDSTILALVLEELRRRAPFPFTVDAVLLDQQQPGFSADAFCDWFRGRGPQLTLIREDTHSLVQEKTAPGKSFCGLCSRLRRGILYNYAHEHGYTKLALGHHREDLNETLLLNLFYGGRLAAMPPTLISDDGRNQVIRPLCSTPEAWLQEAARELRIPVIPCNLCGNQEGLRRQEMKALLDRLERTTPGIRGSMLSAQRNVRPTQLLWRSEHG